MDGLARLHHMTRSVESPASFQAKYALQVAFSSKAPRINRPAAIRELPAAHVIRQLGNALRIGLSANVQSSSM